jgi:hypothetical protein
MSHPAGSIHSEYGSWHPSYPSGSSATCVTASMQHSSLGPYVTHIPRHATNLPSRCAPYVWQCNLTDFVTASKIWVPDRRRVQHAGSVVRIADHNSLNFCRTNPFFCSLSLPELPVAGASAGLQPRGRRPQHSSSSGEEAAFCTETLGASHYARLQNPAPLGVKTSVYPAYAGSRQPAEVEDHPRSVAAGTHMHSFRSNAPQAATANPDDEPHGLLTARSTHLTESQHPPSHHAAGYGSFPKPTAGTALQASALKAASALKDGTSGSPMFPSTIAGSLGGVGPGFAGGNDGLGSSAYGAPGYTSSGYHGMQVDILLDHEAAMKHPECEACAGGHQVLSVLAAERRLLRHCSPAGVLAVESAPLWKQRQPCSGSKRQRRQPTSRHLRLWGHPGRQWPWSW